MFQRTKRDFALKNRAGVGGRVVAHLNNSTQERVGEQPLATEG